MAKKYLDQSRFPKIVTKGYEEDFKILHIFVLQKTVKEITEKMFEFKPIK